MCGRATIIDPDGVERIGIEFSKKFVPSDWKRPRYNIRPTQELPAIRVGEDGELELTLLRWGLIPSWAKEPSLKFPTFNARAETLGEKPTFRGPFRNRRCAIVIDGFYEWPKKPNRDRRPRHVRFADRRPFTLAGLWDRWTDPVTGVVVETCTIVTTVANALLASVPHDRMPVILDDTARGVWLRTGAVPREELEAVLVPRRPDDMELVVTSEQFVNYGADDPRCVEPVE
jgi:putative SOS response-associated peptidase YedK